MNKTKQKQQGQDGKAFMFNLFLYFAIVIGLSFALGTDETGTSFQSGFFMVSFLATVFFGIYLALEFSRRD